MHGTVFPCLLIMCVLHAVVHCLFLKRYVAKAANHTMCSELIIVHSVSSNCIKSHVLVHIIIWIKVLKLVKWFLVTNNE